LGAFWLRSHSNKTSGSDHILIKQIIETSSNDVSLECDGDPDVF